MEYSITPAKKRILIIGSTNTDMIIRVNNFPSPGETLLGEHFLMSHGGKGANQAVAAARLQGNVSFITKIGNDLFGARTLQQLENESIPVDYVITDQYNPSGIALITVDRRGENTIVVAPGANGALSREDLQKSMGNISEFELVLLQLEIPLDTVSYGMAEAMRKEKKIILNPAPAMVLPDSLFRDLYIITPNKSEAEKLSGIKIRHIESANEASRRLRDKGVQNVIITLGEEGAYLLNDKSSVQIPSPKVQAVDTTAAGDIFNGALAVALAEGQEFESAIKFANYAAAISVTKPGAQVSSPYRDEVDIAVRQGLI